MSTVEWVGVAFGITMLAYFLGINVGHSLALSRITLLIERDKLSLAAAVKSLEEQR